jgi:uncharacterized protein (DUF427 family)
VWDYPRPPRLERTPARLGVVLAGVTVADTTLGWRVLETSHPPTYYLPRRDIRAECLVPAAGRSWCEWKGRASHLDVVAGTRRAPGAAWCYLEPTDGFAAIAGHVAFHAALLDECWVDEERVVPQEGGFYGGWITSRVVGPFKGGPGSMGW